MLREKFLSMNQNILKSQSMTIDQGLELAKLLFDNGQVDKAEQIYEQILAAQPDNAEVLYLVGRNYFQHGNIHEAEKLVKTATTLDPQKAQYFSFLGHTLRAQGKKKESIDLFQHAISLNPSDLSACSGLAFTLMEGEPYGDVISRFHALLKPKTYVEIGIETGKTLAKAHPPTVAIGIDPDPVIEVEFTAKTKIYPIPSDDFFSNYDLSVEMEYPIVEFAFLDGLHQFEQTLRDFINVEKFAFPKTIIVIHDCLPLNQFTASRVRQSEFWSGDVWKIIPCLKRYRPDLNVFVVATPPTGLGVVTNLDPSNALGDNWQNILDTFVELEYKVREDERESFLSIVKNNWKSILDRLQR